MGGQGRRNRRASRALLLRQLCASGQAIGRLGIRVSQSAEADRSDHADCLEQQQLRQGGSRRAGVNLARRCGDVVSRVRTCAARHRAGHHVSRAGDDAARLRRVPIAGERTLGADPRGPRPFRAALPDRSADAPDARRQSRSIAKVQSGLRDGGIPGRGHPRHGAAYPARWRVRSGGVRTRSAGAHRDATRDRAPSPPAAVRSLVWQRRLFGRVLQLFVVGRHGRGCLAGVWRSRRAVGQGAGRALPHGDSRRSQLHRSRRGVPAVPRAGSGRQGALREARIPDQLGSYTIGAMLVSRRLIVFALVFLTIAPVLGQSRNERWVATWATALVARAPAPPAPVAGASATPAPGAGRAGGRGSFPAFTVSNQTLRQVVRVSVGGSRVRVVLSNAFGTAPLQIGAAHVALRDKDATVVASSTRPLTFGGNSTGTILAGATLLSDPVDLIVPPVSDLVVDLFLPGDLFVGPSPVATHNGASQTNYLSETGNHSGATVVPVARNITTWFLIARVEVVAPATTATIVAFGDSITDGAASTADTNSRWPDVLARRLAARKGNGAAVGNAGIRGNRVPGGGAGVSALARFDRDVLMQTGITHVIVLEGINDIGIARANPSPSAADLIAGHKQLIERSEEHTS